MGGRAKDGGKVEMKRGGKYLTIPSPSSPGGLDVTLSQRECANDLTTWVIQNKLLYTGPNALDQFCQALLLHLQAFGSGNSLASAASLLLNQVHCVDPIPVPET